MAVKLSTKVEQGLFKVYVEKMDNVYTHFTDNLRTHLLKQRALGISDNEIIKGLQADQENGQGLFKKLAGDIESNIDETSFGLFGSFSNNWNDTVNLYDWILDPSAEHCDSCLFQAGRGSLPINEFPIPGTQPTEGATNCNEYCKCTLDRAN